MFVVSGHNYDDGQRACGQAMDYLESARAGHIEVEQDEIGAEAGDLGDRVVSVTGFADDFDIGKESELFAQYLACDWFIVHDQGTDWRCSRHGKGGVLPCKHRRRPPAAKCSPFIGVYRPLARIVWGVRSEGR